MYTSEPWTAAQRTQWALCRANDQRECSATVAAYSRTGSQIAVPGRQPSAANDAVHTLEWVSTQANMAQAMVSEERSG